jgi:hypothetical protein
VQILKGDRPEVTPGRIRACVGAAIPKLFPVALGPAVWDSPIETECLADAFFV